MKDKAVQQSIKRKFYKNDRWLLVLWIMILYSVVNGYQWPQTTLIQYVERVSILFYLFITIAFAGKFSGYWLKLLLVSQGIVSLLGMYAFKAPVLSFISPMPAMLFEEMLLGKRIKDLPYVTILYALTALCFIFYNSELDIMTVLIILQALLGLAIAVKVVQLNLLSLVRQAERIVQTNIKLHQANRQIAELTAEKIQHELARDLHDTLTQDLVGIGMRLTVIDQLLGMENVDKAKKTVKETQKMAQTSIMQSRRLIKQYRNQRATDEWVALKKTTIDTVDIIEKDYALTTDFIIDHDVELPVSEMVDIQRFIGEALMNVVKHGKTDQAELKMTVTDKWLTIEVLNHGQPWTPDDDTGNHFGIKNMKERAAKYNGDVVFQPLSKGLKVVGTFEIKEKKQWNIQ